METPESTSIIQMIRDVFFPETLNVGDVNIAKERCWKFTDIEFQVPLHHPEAPQGHALIRSALVDVEIFVMHRVTQEIAKGRVERHNGFTVTVRTTKERGKMLHNSSLCPHVIWSEDRIRRN